LHPEIRRSVKKGSEYVVRFSELKEEKETFEFFLEDSFFQLYRNSEWDSGRVNAVVDIIKRPDGITLDCQMNGELLVTCDRCLELFKLPVNFRQSLYVKYGKEAQELDDNIVVVTREENQIDLGRFFYEYLLLSVPMKRVHPGDTGEKDGCNREMIEKLKRHLVNQQIENNDPRWDELKKLIDKN
jgi:uncharacterized protein